MTATVLSNAALEKKKRGVPWDPKALLGGWAPRTWFSKWLITMVIVGTSPIPGVISDPGPKWPMFSWRQ